MTGVNVESNTAVLKWCKNLMFAIMAAVHRSIGFPDFTDEFGNSYLTKLFVHLPSWKAGSSRHLGSVIRMNCEQWYGCCMADLSNILISHPSSSEPCGSMHMQAIAPLSFVFSTTLPSIDSMHGYVRQSQFQIHHQANCNILVRMLRFMLLVEHAIT